MTVAAATPVTFILSRITKMRFSTTFIPPETRRMKRGRSAVSVRPENCRSEVINEQEWHGKYVYPKICQCVRKNLLGGVYEGKEGL